MEVPQFPRKKIKQYPYNKKNYAEQYEEFSKGQDPDNLVLKNILGDVDFRNKIILDLGAGTGKFSIPLAKKAKLVYSLDKSKQMLKILRNKIRKVRNVKIFRGTFSKIPLPKNSVDVIISAWAFPRYSLDWDRDWKEILRVLRPEGKVIIVENDVKGHAWQVSEEEKWLSKDIHTWLRLKKFEKRRRFCVRVCLKCKENIVSCKLLDKSLVEYLLTNKKTQYKLPISIFLFQKP